MIILKCHHILLLWQVTNWTVEGNIDINMKLPYMKVTYKLLQQNDWSLRLVLNYTNSFDTGLFPLISRTNTNLFSSVGLQNRMTYLHTFSSRFCNSAYQLYLKWLIPKTTRTMKLTKSKQDPKLSCIKISGLFWNFGIGRWIHS